MTEADDRMLQRVKLIKELKKIYLRQEAIKKRLVNLDFKDWREFRDRQGDMPSKHLEWYAFDHPKSKGRERGGYVCVGLRLELLWW